MGVLAWVIDRHSGSARTIAGAPVPHPGRPGLFVLIMAGACLVASRSPALADGALAQSLWYPNGPVYATHRDGNKLYVGGRFDYVGPHTGSGVVVNLSTGLPEEKFALIDGQVNAVVADGSGGWFVGGSFSRAGGVPRQHFVHVLANGSLGSLQLETDAPIQALCYDSGRLYVAGPFTRVRGVDRRGLAAIRLDTGLVDVWDPRPNFDVLALLAVQDRLYVSGWFTEIGGVPRSRLAAFSRQELTALDWNPGANYVVRCLAADQDYLFVGGQFGQLSGSTRPYVGAVRHDTGALVPGRAR